MTRQRKSLLKTIIILLKAFNDTLTIEKKQTENAGNPYVIDYRYPRIAFDYPYPLTGLAAGIKDVTPVTEKVNYYTDYAAVDREITNPAILLKDAWILYMLIYTLFHCSL